MQVAEAQGQTSSAGCPLSAVAEGSPASSKGRLSAHVTRTAHKQRSELLVTSNTKHVAWSRKPLARAPLDASLVRNTNHLAEGPAGSSEAPGRPLANMLRAHTSHSRLQSAPQACGCWCSPQCFRDDGLRPGQVGCVLLISLNAHKLQVRAQGYSGGVATTSCRQHSGPRHQEFHPLAGAQGAVAVCHGLCHNSHLHVLTHQQGPAGPGLSSLPTNLHWSERLVHHRLGHVAKQLVVDDHPGADAKPAPSAAMAPGTAQGGMAR